MEFNKIYPSGLRVVAKLMPSLYTVSLGVFVDVGSVREDANENGFSHFIEHLLFKGTKRRTAADISEEMDSLGAHLNAFTSKDNTCFLTKSASGDLEKCMDMLSDMYFNATFPEDELKREKSVVMEEISMNDDRPDDLCQDIIASAVYKNQKIGQTILGTVENIQNSDRHNIIEFRNKHYLAANTVVSVAGNFDIDALDKLVLCYFETNFTHDSKETDEEEKSVCSAEFLSVFKDVEQSHICLALPGISIESPQIASFSVMSNILGGGMSSRLFQTIREKNGLAYSVYSYPSAYKNSGYLEIYCGTNPENLAKVVELTTLELKKFISCGITEAELNRAKAQAVNGLYMGLETSMNVMMAYGRCMLKQNKLFDIEKKANDYKAVTLECVNGIIRDTFTKPFASCYVGKKHKKFKAVSEINLH